MRKCFSTDGRFHVYAQRVTEDKKPCNARRPYFCVPARFGCGGGDVAPLGLAGDGDSLSASAYQMSPAISRVASSRLTLRALFAGTSWLLCERAAQLSLSAERTHVQWATSPTGGPRQFMCACSPSPIAQPPAGMAAARSPPWPTATHVLRQPSCLSHSLTACAHLARAARGMANKTAHHRVSHEARQRVAHRRRRRRRARLSPGLITFILNGVSSTHSPSFACA